MKVVCDKLYHETVTEGIKKENLGIEAGNAA